MPGTWRTPRRLRPTVGTRGLKERFHWWFRVRGLTRGRAGCSVGGMRMIRRGRRIEPQLERSRPVDEPAQFGVFGAQMRHCFVRVEGKFRAPAVVNHRRTVYRAGTLS